MSLKDAILAFAKAPHSTQKRAGLATALEELEDPRAADVWEATIRAAASRGQFFTALSLCRLHLKDSSPAPLLTKMAARYSADRKKDGPTLSPPVLEPLIIEMPETDEALAELAFSLGVNLEGIGLPEDAKMPNLPLFGDVTAIEFVVLALEAEPIPLKPGDVIIRQGERERALYVFSHGKAKVTQGRPDGQEIELAKVKAPAMFGEMTLLSRVPRRATVTMDEGFGMAWRVDGALLERLSKTHPALEAHLHSLLKRRLLHNLARASVLFSNLSQKERDAMFASFEILQVEPTRRVISQGDKMPGLYIILHGFASVWTEADGEEMTLVANLSEGDTFGEFSILTGAPAVADVTMPQGGMLFYLSNESAKKLIASVPSLEEILKDMMEGRRKVLDEVLAHLDDDYEELDDSAIIEDDEEPDEAWLVGKYDS